jgi:acetate kinase
LEFLGVETDEVRSEADEPVIFKVGSSVTVRVIPTDEERDIAQTALQLFAAKRQK